MTKSKKIDKKAVKKAAKPAAFQFPTSSSMEKKVKKITTPGKTGNADTSVVKPAKTKAKPSAPVKDNSEKSGTGSSKSLVKSKTTNKAKDVVKGTASLSYTIDAMNVRAYSALDDALKAINSASNRLKKFTLPSTCTEDVALLGTQITKARKQFRLIASSTTK